MTMIIYFLGFFGHNLLLMWFLVLTLSAPPFVFMFVSRGEFRVLFFQVLKVFTNMFDGVL